MLRTGLKFNQEKFVSQEELDQQAQAALLKMAVDKLRAPRNMRSKKSEAA
jgi:hypothetical protein